MDEYWVKNYVNKSCDVNGLALDIGANVGEWSSLMSKYFKQVISVEPDPRAFKELKASTPPSNVICKNAAVSSRSERLSLYLRDSPLQTSLLMEHPIGGCGAAEAPIVETVDIQTITLDQIADISDLSIVFIKVDVEGAEEDVLAGATYPIFSRVKWLIEIHNKEAEVMGQLKRLGYESPTIIKHPNPAAHPQHFWIYAEPN